MRFARSAIDFLGGPGGPPHPLSETLPSRQQVPCGRFSTIKVRRAQSYGTAVVRQVIRLGDTVLRNLDDAIDAVRAMPAGDHPILDVARDEIRKLCITVQRNAERTDRSR